MPDNDLSNLPTTIASLVNLKELDISKNGRYPFCRCNLNYMKTNNSSELQLVQIEYTVWFSVGKETGAALL